MLFIKSHGFKFSYLNFFKKIKIFFTVKDNCLNPTNFNF